MKKRSHTRPRLLKRRTQSLKRQRKEKPAPSARQGTYLEERRPEHYAG